MSVPPISAREAGSGRIPQAVSLAAATVSMVLSGKGVHDALAVTHMPEAMRLAASGTVTLLISGLIYTLMRRAGQARASRHFKELLRRPRMSVALPLLGGLTMMAFSVITAFSAMVFMKNGDMVQAQATALNTAAVTEPLRQMARSYAVAAAEASAVADLALAQSQTEAAYGGTCGATGSGTGPYARMRADHASRFGAVRDDALALSGRATDLVARFAVVATQADLDAAYRQAQQLALDPARARVAQVTAAMRLGYRSDGFFFEGQTRTCADPSMVGALDRLLTAAETPINLSPVAPVLPKASLFDTFGLAASALSDETASDHLGGPMVYVFLTFALVVDTVCAAFAWISGAAIGRRLTEAEIQELHRHNWILEQFLWRFPEAVKRGVSKRSTEDPASSERLEQAFFIVPEGGDGEKNRDARFFAYSFGLKVDAARQHVPVSQIPEAFAPFAERLRLASGGATSFNVYPVTDEAVYDRLERHKRACALALGAISVTSDAYGDINDKRWIAAAKEGLSKDAGRSGNVHRL